MARDDKKEKNLVSNHKQTTTKKLPRMAKLLVDPGVKMVMSEN